MNERSSITVEITRRDFCNRLLAFCGCLLGVGALDGGVKTVFKKDADELLYFMRQFPDIQNSSVCLVGAFSQELLLNCFEALGESNVRFLSENRRFFLLLQSAETSAVSAIYKEFQHKYRLRVISTDEFENAHLHLENLVSVVYDGPMGQVVPDATLRRVLKASKSSIVATGVQRVVDCTFLPVESCAWNGKIMTIGERAVVITSTGKNADEIG